MRPRALGDPVSYQLRTSRPTVQLWMPHLVTGVLYVGALVESMTWPFMCRHLV